MNISYFRSSNKSELLDEANLINCTKANSLKIDKQMVEYSDLNKSLENRDEFRQMMHSLDKDDILVITDITQLSIRIGELVKILDCLFSKEVKILVCKYNLFVESNTPSFEIFRLLNQIREENNKLSFNKFGRPKGRISKSKFDDKKDEIIKFLKEKRSVSEIARILAVSRTSLKDYINARQLKEIALQNINKEIVYEKLPKNKCIKEYK